MNYFIEGINKILKIPEVCKVLVSDSRFEEILSYYKPRENTTDNIEIRIPPKNLNLVKPGGDDPDNVYIAYVEKVR